MRRISRIVQVAALAGLLMALPAGAARGAAEFGSYRVLANAAAVGFTYDQASVAAPVHPIVDLSLARSTALLEGGPTGYALSSLLWPGPLAANVGPVVASEARKQSGPFARFIPDIPAYPVRAESFHPGGPASQRSDAGAGAQAARSSGEEAHADTEVVETVMPGVLTAAQLSSTTDATQDGAQAVSAARASVTDVNLLNGLLTIDGVVSEARATTDATKGAVAGAVRIAGARVNGTEVVIDEKGVRADGETYGFASEQLTKAVQAALAEAGVTIAVAGPIDLVDGASAERTVGGLVINIRSEALRGHVDALPPDLRRQVVGYLGFDHDVQIVLAGVTVATDAQPGFDFDFDFGGGTGGFDGGGTDGGGGFPGVGGPVTFDPGSPAAPPVTGGGGDGGNAPLFVASPVDVAGVPGGAGILLALLGLAGAAFLRRLADGAAIAAATTCPAEER